MNDKKINLRRQRELGEILNDTFTFVRQNYKDLLKVFVKNVGPAFLFLFAAIAYYNYSALGAVESGDIFNMVESGAGYGNLIIAGLALLVGVVVYYAFLYTSIFSYLKFYIHDKDNIDFKGISDGSYQKFWSTLALVIIVSIMLGISLVLCVIPVFYSMVPLSLVFAIHLFERKDVFESIGDGFTIIKDNFWITFATILIFIIITVIISFIFQIPMTFYALIKGFLVNDEINWSDAEGTYDWVYITLSVLSSAFQYLLHGFYAIMTAFIYFNLKERRHFTGTLETIDAIGKRNEDAL